MSDPPVDWQSLNFKIWNRRKTRIGSEGRVNIKFVIQKDGSIGNIQLRGPDKSLETEARRIIDNLPKMVPGKQRGQPVKVPFSLPINFKMQ